MSAEIKQLISHISRMEKLDAEFEELLNSELKLTEYKKGDFILKQGSVCKHNSYVVSGCSKTFYTDRDGNEHVISFAIEDWWSGDLASFLTQLPADFSVQCLEDTTVIQFSNKQLQKYFSESVAFNNFFRKLIQNAYVQSQKRIVHNFSLTAKERYIQFSEKYPQFLQRIPQYLIASYLGITREFLSKVRKELVTKQK